MAIQSRADLIDYALRRLGHPVLEVNIDEDQMEDRVDDALQLFSKYHFDGVQRAYFKHQITQEEFDRQWIEAPEPIASVVQLLPINDGNGSIFDVRYQMALSDLYYFGSLDLVGYDITRSYMSLLQQLLNPQKAIRFSRVENRIYIDTNWQKTLKVGTWVVIEAYRVLDPQDLPEIYNDVLLKNYVTSLFKRQWGQNLSKFGSIQLPGGVTLDGVRMIQEADAEIEKIENQIRDEGQLPIDFMMG